MVTNRKMVGTTSMEIEDRRTHSSYDILQYKILPQNFLLYLCLTLNMFIMRITKPNAWQVDQISKNIILLLLST